MSPYITKASSKTVGAQKQKKSREPGKSQNMTSVQWLKGNVCSALKQLEERETFLVISPFFKEVRSLFSIFQDVHKHKFLKNLNICGPTSGYPHKQNNLKAPKITGGLLYLTTQVKKQR